MSVREENKDLKKILEKLYPQFNIDGDVVKSYKNFREFFKQGGFPFNKVDANPGKQASNTGDAVEALFVFRVLAYGLNVSKSESRITDYDLIVEFEKRTYRVQVKSFEFDEANMSLKDRARGGQGIDHNHESNQGRAFTSERADVIAFVDKRTGLCFLVPLSWIEETGKDKLSREDRMMFKEKWDVFYE